MLTLPNPWGYNHCPQVSILRDYVIFAWSLGDCIHMNTILRNQVCAWSIWYTLGYAAPFRKKKNGKVSNSNKHAISWFYSVPDTCNPILATWYLLPDTCYLLLVTCYLSLGTCYLILVSCYLLPETCYLILIFKYLIFDKCYSSITIK